MRSTVEGRWVGGWVATKFSVKHQGKDIHHPPSTIYKWPFSDLPRPTLCPSLSLSFTIEDLLFHLASLSLHIIMNPLENRLSLDLSLLPWHAQPSGTSDQVQWAHTEGRQVDTWCCCVVIIRKTLHDQTKSPHVLSSSGVSQPSLVSVHWSR